jgi:pimeloyl-ACP methyl ester carboxylesterase
VARVTVGPMTITTEAFTSGPRVTTTDGVEIATYDLGGTGPPLLLCHATGFHALVWLALAPLLRDRFHCVAFDARGHGRSGKAPSGNYQWGGFALDVKAAIEGVGLEQPRAVGHSCGGAALLLAEEAWPGLVRSMYCYEPVVSPVGAGSVHGRANAMADSTRRRREVFAGRDEAYTNFRNKAPFSELAPDAVRAYVDHGFEDLADGRVRLRCRKEDEAAIYEMALQHSAFERLGEVTCPVTIVCGGTVPHFGPDQIAAVAARLPAAEIEILPGMGHFGPMQRPAEVAASIANAFDTMDALTRDRL